MKFKVFDFVELEGRVYMIISRKLYHYEAIDKEGIITKIAVECEMDMKPVKRMINPRSYIQAYFSGKEKDVENISTYKSLNLSELFSIFGTLLDVVLIVLLVWYIFY